MNTSAAANSLKPAVVTRRQALHASILGTGSALPERVVPNTYFVDELGLNTSDAWITERTGIRERRFASNGETLVSLATEAGLRALEAAGLCPDQIDIIVLATSTAAYRLPASACLVQQNLLAENAVAFDINSGCAGFEFAFDVVVRYLQSTGGNGLVIGADLGSELCDPTDRGTVIFFGDGAGAAVISTQGEGRVLASRLHTRGNPRPVQAEARGPITMDGRAVWEFVHQVLPETICELCAEAGFSPTEIHLVVPHQANSTMICSAIEPFHISRDRIFLNLAHYGNTLAASIPIGLDEALRTGRARAGDLVLLVGFGAGLAWGGSLLRL